MPPPQRDTSAEARGRPRLRLTDEPHHTTPAASPSLRWRVNGWPIRLELHASEVGDSQRLPDGSWATLTVE